jgi:hypothetical protein
MQSLSRPVYRMMRKVFSIMTLDLMRYCAPWAVRLTKLCTGGRRLCLNLQYCGRSSLHLRVSRHCEQWVANGNQMIFTNAMSADTRKLSALSAMPISSSLQAMLRPTLRHAFFDAANLISFLQSLSPFSISRILLFQTLRSAQLRQQALANQVPRDESQVGESTLVANQPARAVSLQTDLENADHALDLVRVAVDGRLELFGMKACEPGRLTIIWPLAYAL